MSKVIHLGVNTVIGTGDPFDQRRLIPLINDWGVPKECIWSLKEKCENRISRLYALREKIDIGEGVMVSTVGICEEHHKILYKDENIKEEISNGDVR